VIRDDIPGAEVPHEDSAGAPVHEPVDGAPSRSDAATQPAERAATAETPAAGMLAKLQAAREIYEGVFFAPYGRVIHRAYLDERDAFLLLTFSDLLGVPNPVHFYTLELYPELLEQFHEWHLRMGMDHAPDGGWRCC
jgi:hypothetical protein